MGRGSCRVPGWVSTTSPLLCIGLWITDATRGHRTGHPAKRAALLRDSTDPDGGAARMERRRLTPTVGRTPHRCQEAIVSTILIGIDASASSADAVAFGRRLASASD